MKLADILKDEFVFIMEAPTDMPEDADMTKQLEILMQRLEATKKALGIANKLPNLDDRKKHRSRVMTYMNQLRTMFNQIADHLEKEIEAERTMNHRMAA